MARTRSQTLNFCRTNSCHIFQGYFLVSLTSESSPNNGLASLCQHRKTSVIRVKNSLQFLTKDYQKPAIFHLWSSSSKQSLWSSLWRISLLDIPHCVRTSTIPTTVLTDLFWALPWPPFCDNLDRSLRCLTWHWYPKRFLRRLLNFSVKCFKAAFVDITSSCRIEFSSKLWFSINVTFCRWRPSSQSTLAFLSTSTFVCKACTCSPTKSRSASTTTIFSVLTLELLPHVIVSHRFVLQVKHSLFKQCRLHEIPTFMTYTSLQL